MCFKSNFSSDGRTLWFSKRDRGMWEHIFRFHHLCFMSEQSVLEFVFWKVVQSRRSRTQSHCKLHIANFICSWTRITLQSACSWWCNRNLYIHDDATLSLTSMMIVMQPAHVRLICTFMDSICFALAWLSAKASDKQPPRRKRNETHAIVRRNHVWRPVWLQNCGALVWLSHLLSSWSLSARGIHVISLGCSQVWHLCDQFGSRVAVVWIAVCMRSLNNRWFFVALSWTRFQRRLVSNAIVYTPLCGTR